MGRCAVGEAIETCLQVALGLREAHSKGIVHRDIKPANLLIARSGVVKIVDFGLALLPVNEKLTREKLSVGTPGYMSPEQVKAETVDRRSDLWSLGVTVYESMIGSLPFSAPSIPALVHSIVFDDVDWERIRKTEGGARVEPVLRKLLAKNPNDRYASADELIADLTKLTASHRKEDTFFQPQTCIAVLPFSNLNNTDTEYFSDGLTEELINALAQVEGLRVVSRSSVFAFKGQPIDIKTIGERLKVPTVLEGSVRSAGNRLRVTVQLTNVADGFNVWSERFDRELRDIFELQDEITLRIIDKLKIKLTPSREVASPDWNSTNRLKAYDLYLEGKYNWNLQTEEGLNKAIVCFERAIQVDPLFGAATAGLADALTFLGFHGLAPSLDVFPKARAAATAALQLDPALPDANISMGYVKLYHDWNWIEAEYYLRRAIELNPSSAKAYYSLMLCLVQSGRFEPGRAALQKALELDYANVGATSLFTTAEDLARWLINFEDKKIGGADVIKQMHQQGALNSGKQLAYAFGLSIGPYRGLNTVGHAGGDAAYRSFAFWFPDQRFGVVVLSNFGSLNPQQMGMRIADLYLADKLEPAPPKTAPVERTAVKVDAAILQSYAGRYLLDGRTLMIISKEGDKLMGQPGNAPKAELIPQSETTFFVKEANSEFTFERDEKGNFIRFTMNNGSQSQSAKRLNSPTTPAQLTQFAGDYYSPELGTSYTVVVKDGKLVAQHRRHDDIPLTELDDDLFSSNRWYFQTVQFTRDSEKRITGFRLTSGRARNVRFDRQ